MTQSLQRGILRVSEIFGYDENKYRVECFRELPVDARQCMNPWEDPLRAFGLKQRLLCVGPDGRLPLSEAAHCWMRTEGSARFWVGK